MDFTPTEEQAAARDLAADILTDLSTHERLSALDGGTDAELWKALCAAGIPAAAEDIGLLGLALVLEEQGRRTAQIPLAATCAYGLLPVGAYGSETAHERLLPALREGTAVATGAFPYPGRRSAVTAVQQGGAWRLSGTAPMVPWLREATHVLVPALCTEDGEVRCFLVGLGAGPGSELGAGPGAKLGSGSGSDPGPELEPGGRGPIDPVQSVEEAARQPVRSGPEGVRVTAVETTAPWSAGRLELEHAPGDPLSDGAYEPTLARARTAFAALQAGVCAGSLARAVAYTCEREQFGRPLSTNQGVQLRAADAHMDTEAIRVTSYEAAWRHDQELPAATHSLTAAWWAAEAGRRVVHAGQHLHGGIGADVDHPVHRHFLWGRQLDAYLGSPAQLLAELGGLLADADNDTERLEES